MECHHCGDMSLSSLRSRLAFFSDSNPDPPRDLRGKSSGAEDLSAQRWVSLRRQYPCVPHSLLTVRFPPFSSPARTSIHLWLRAIWSHSEEAITARWMTACHWRLRMRRSCRARQLLPQPCPLAFCASNPGMDADLFHVLSNAVDELGLEWSPPDETSRSRLDEWFLPGRRQAARQRASPFFPVVHDEITKFWHAPNSYCLRASSSSTLTSVDGAKEKGYDCLPPLDESVAAHLCPPRAIGWKAKAAHPSKPCRTTSALAGRAYSSAGQAASAFHSMAVLQVFQDEFNPNPTAFKKLHSATDLAQCATKMTAQAICRSMASLMVLERHLWLNLMEMKDADKVPFLDSPVSPTSLFGPAVEGFAERFTAEQKSSQAMWHFLPKHSSSAAASSRPKMVPTKPAKAALPAVQTAAKPEPPRSRLVRSHAPKHGLHGRGLHIGSAQQRSHLAPKWWVCWRKEQWKQFPQFRASQASTAVTSSSPRRMVV